MTDILTAFRGADFNWATYLQDVWSDPLFDVPELHGELRREFAETLASMHDRDARSPLGWFVVGSGGVGKTHLLGAMRREAARQGAGFILVDMTDVRDFWEVVLQGYLDSLQSHYRDDAFQYQVLLRNFINRFSRADEAARNVQRLAQQKTTALSKDLQRIVDALRKKYPKETLEYQDVIRALICLNSEHSDVTNTGYSWLQGQEIEEGPRDELGFSRKQRSPMDIVRALSWFMSLCGPTVVAFDQLDPIIQQVRHQTHSVGDSSAEEIGTARSIIEQIGGGLGAMIDKTFNTLTIVSCVESTLNLITELVHSTYLDRYEGRRRLQRPSHAEAYRLLIQERMAPVFQQAAFDPPYPTWPFPSSLIDQLVNNSPREVLKLCDQHRGDCVRAGGITELTTLAPVAPIEPRPTPAETVSQFEHLDERFASYRAEVDPDALLDEKSDDDQLAPLYGIAFDCLVHEHEAEFPPHIEPIVEREFSGGKTTKPLHARLRVVDHSQDSREDHYCIRVIQRRHHSAYGTRLKAAMTQSGIDKSLKFRQLTIIRSYEPPAGQKTESLTARFRQAGGRFHTPTEDELRSLAALQRLGEEGDPEYLKWLTVRKPVTQLGLGDILTAEKRFTDPPRTSEATPAESPVTVENPATVPTSNGTDRESNDEAPTLLIEDEPSSLEPTTDPTPTAHPPHSESSAAERKTDPASLPFGRRIMGLGELGDVVSLPLTALTKHTIILGGSGSGKSVTVRRLVEEAVLAGIPSIIVDCAQDMCCFDRPWPEPNEYWSEGDAARAEQFLQRAEQIVWTPGSLSSGNPLLLRPLPDFSPVKDDPEELNDAVLMACDGLKEIVAAGNSLRAKNCYGILVHSLNYFAKHFPSKGLNGYIQFLSELPTEAELGIPNETKLAAEIAGRLRVEQTTNPLLKEEGTSLDPLVLFGDDRPRDTVRISVISLVKLKGQAAAQSFLNQLAMQLFSWIKQHPTPPGDRPLRGLLVIDEARDFVPSRTSTECKESMMRLAAQARKYRLGLIFATQHPKDIETKIVGNAATHLYGLNNSPASLATLEELMTGKGGSGKDIPKLERGQFYIHNADAQHKAPIKIQVPISLSCSPSNPLEESEVMRLASASAERLG